METYVTFMDLEKAYDKVCREELWMVLDEYVDGIMIRSMNSFYDGSVACLRFEGRVWKYIEEKRSLRRGCVISPWRFNIFFERVVRQVNAWATGMGAKMRDRNGGSEKLQKYYMRMTMFVAETKKHLQYIVDGI